jgi:hypothetical protein
MCLFCQDEEFVINTPEDIRMLEESTCEKHRKVLSLVLLDLTITQLAKQGHPAVQLLSVEDESK